MESWQLPPNAAMWGLPGHRGVSGLGSAEYSFGRLSRKVGMPREPLDMPLCVKFSILSHLKEKSKRAHSGN